MGTLQRGGHLLDGRYRLLELLGEGGVGCVYRATDEHCGRTVAVKQLLPGAPRELSAQMLAREYRTLAQLHHPSIIAVFDYGSEAGEPYYVMELLEGGSLREEAGCSVASAARYLRDIASCLALLHARRLVHRDVSPNNVQLSHEGRAKLIDFGALAPFGRARRVIGTPPCIAPEALRGAPLDARTDLYALGAVAYYLLTGRHAYPAHTLRQLLRMWSEPPPRPVELRPEIPEGLDTLVMALLSADPLARPQSAAEVIDRLNHLAGPESEPLEISRAYLDTPVFVAQHAVMKRVRKAIESLAHARGSALLVCGGPGAGKSRVIEEIAVQAQLAHALVISPSVGGVREPFALARALVSAALQLAPGPVREAAAPHLPVIGHVLPELDQAEVALCAVPENPQAWRLQLQSDLASFWRDLAARVGALVLLVDDCAQADEASLAMLAALADDRGHPLLLACSDGAQEPERDRPGLRALHQGCRRLDLAPLLRDEIARLAESLFGPVPHLERLSQLLYEQSAGNPLLCLELAQALLRDGEIRYVDGTWFLPQEIPKVRAEGLAGLLELRLERLGPELARTAAGLSILRGSFSPEHVHVMFPEMSPAALWEAMDTLLAEGLLRPTTDGYAFAQGGHRALLRARLAEADARALHGRIGRSLAAVAQDGAPGLLLDAGYHLLQAGELDEGADLLVAAGQRLLSDQNALADAAPVLEQAYERYRALGREPGALLHLLVPLAVAGYMVDREYADRHGEVTLRELLRVTGLSAARRMSPLLRGKSAVTVGALGALGAAAMRARDGGLLPDLARGRRALIERYVQLVTVVVALVGVGALLLDGARVRAIVAALEPFGRLPEDQIGSLVYRYCRMLLHVVEGREAEAQQVGRRILQQFDDAALFPELDAETRTNWRGGLLLGYGINECYRDDDGALSVAEALDGVGTQLHAMFASQVRMLYHAYRGEVGEAERHRKQVEQCAMRGGTTWQAELVVPASLLLPYSLAEDRVGLARVAEQLEAYARDAASLQPYVQLARAMLARVRGEPGALEQLQRAVEPFGLHERAGWLASRADLARAHVEAGDPARARELCLELLSELTDADAEYPMHYFHAGRALASAESALGDHAGARRRIADLLARCRDGGNPLLRGVLHDEACRIELAAGDVGAAERELIAVRGCFRSTGNPALIARAERLAHRVSAASQSASVEAARGEVAALLDGCQELRQCASRVLELLAADAGASGGRLFIRRGAGVEIAAELDDGSVDGVLQDHELVTIATAVMGVAREGDDELPTRTASVSGEDERSAPRVRPVVLRVHGSSQTAAVGTALLWSDDQLPRVPDSLLVSSLSAALAVRLGG